MAKPGRETLGEMISRHSSAKVLEVLDRHGVTFCAGCYLTLFSSPEKVAAYHAVPDVRLFLAELRAAAAPRSRRRARSRRTSSVP